MRIRSLISGCAIAAIPLLACQRRIDLGDLSTESPGIAGAPTTDDGASGGAGGETTLPDEPTVSEFPERLIFASDFESGDLGEWGIDAARLETDGGVLSVESEYAQMGEFSAQVLTDTLGEHIVVSTKFSEQELLIGFWLRVQETYSTLNWPFLHLDQVDEAGSTELWDLGFDASGDGEQRLFLWEKPALAGTEDGSRIADASETFGVERWVHFQVHLLSATDATGFLRVYQDERLVLELADRPTSLGPELQLSFGSFIFAIEPLPATLWLDSVTVYVR